MTRAETTKTPSTTGNTSVLGNISPHHEAGSESPPSYNQLNYNDNLTRFFNSQPKTLTEKEASAFIESSSMYNEDYKNVSQQVLNCDSSSGSRAMRSGSPPFDNSNTATNSESGNGGSNSRGGQNKTTGTKEVNEINSAGDSGENVYSGGTGTGTSGGVSAVANAHHKRIHNRTYGGSGGGGISCCQCSS